MVESIYGTRSSQWWEGRPGKFDVLNLRMIFPASGVWGFPDVARCDRVPKVLEAWHDRGGREVAARWDGALHFFLDDYRFENVWFSPELMLDRARSVGFLLGPDFSLWRGMPLVSQLWNVYRSRWVCAFWQFHGLDVVPTVSWSDESSFGFCFDGLPAGGVVAVSGGDGKADDEEQRLFRLGMCELVSRLKPSVVVCYGRLRWCDDVRDGWGVEVVEFPTFWDRRRPELLE